MDSSLYYNVMEWIIVCIRNVFVCICNDNSLYEKWIMLFKLVCLKIAQTLCNENSCSNNDNSLNQEWIMYAYM